MNKFALTLTALSVMTSVNAFAGDAILDVHGDIKVNGTTVITAEGQVIDASLIDLSKYMVWPAGTYTFATKNVSDELTTLTFDENGNETSWIERKGDEILEQESTVFESDGSYTETTDGGEAYSNTWSHGYNKLVVRPHMCVGGVSETGVLDEFPCPQPIYLYDENGEPIYDEEGMHLTEMVRDEFGELILDDAGQPQQVLEDEYEFYQYYSFNVTRTESCAEVLTFSPLGKQAFSAAKMGIPTSIALKENVTGTRTCETTYTFPDGFPDGVIEEDARAEGFSDGTQVFDVDHVSFETETVTPLVKVSYQLGELLLTDCVVLKQTESNDLYSQYDNDDTDTEINTFCADIGLVEHREPASSDNDWKENIKQRASFVAAE